MTNEQQPFLTCLVHETKKVIPGYVKVVLWVTATILVGFAGYYAITSLQDQAIQLITGIVALFAAVPWWAYAIITAILLPVLYATMVCINKRSGDTFTLIKLFLISLPILLVLVILCGIGGSAYLAIVITVMWLIMAVTLKLADEP